MVFKKPVSWNSYELPTEHECLANNGIVLYLRLFKKTWLTKRSHLQDIEQNCNKTLLLKSLQCTGV